MNTVLIKSYPEPSYNKSEILRFAMCKDDDAVRELMDKCISELCGRLTYKVCYAELNIGEHFKNVNSAMLDKYLADCKSYILFAATVGLEIDRLISKYIRISPATAHMLQAIGAERVEALCDMFCADIKEQYAIVKPRISPGYGDMPLDMQGEVFSLLDCPRKIGVSLNQSLLMTPSKSVTAIIGVLK